MCTKEYTTGSLIITSETDRHCQQKLKQKLYINICSVDCHGEKTFHLGGIGKFTNKITKFSIMK